MAQVGLAGLYLELEDVSGEEWVWVLHFSFSWTSVHIVCVDSTALQCFKNDFGNLSFLSFRILRAGALSVTYNIPIIRGSLGTSFDFLSHLAMT